MLFVVLHWDNIVNELMNALMESAPISLKESLRFVFCVEEAGGSQKLRGQPSPRFETPKRSTRTSQGFKSDDRLDFHESATWLAIV